MEFTPEDKVKLLRRHMPKCSFQIVSVQEVPPDREIDPAIVWRKIVVYDYPVGSSFFTTEVRVVSYPRLEVVFFTIRINYVDPRDMDALFDGVPPSELTENFLAEGGAIEDVYDFWRLSLDELGFSDVEPRDYLEIDIQQKNPAGKFVLRIEFTLMIEDFEEVVRVLCRINERWQREAENLV